uniref:Uncharacterized protein n=1 Tax=Parascaris equorum TaxID=6256 RepID=A0A914S9X0_PAREQ
MVTELIDSRSVHFSINSLKASNENGESSIRATPIPSNHNIIVGVPEIP